MNKYRNRAVVLALAATALAGAGVAVSAEASVAAPYANCGAATYPGADAWAHGGYAKIRCDAVSTASARMKLTCWTAGVPGAVKYTAWTNIPVGGYVILSYKSNGWCEGSIFQSWRADAEIR